MKPPPRSSDPGQRLPAGHVPLDRALSKLGIATRTQARVLIAEGRVRVHGRVVHDPDLPVVPERAAVAVDGAAVQAASPRVLLLHKPRGVVTTRVDPQGRPTVYDCLQGLDAHVVPVGRLDLATSGLLLLTNDTQLANWLTDPASGVLRRYVVTVRGQVDDRTVAAWLQGVDDAGERLQAAEAAVLKRSGRESVLRIGLTEGRTREVRRLCAATGHEVERLKRIAYGGLDLGDLAVGAWREVTLAEVRKAFPQYRQVVGAKRTAVRQGGGVT